MSFSVRQQMIFWGVLFLSAVILLAYLGNILLPFIAGAALAYLLDPLADRLQSFGLSRIWAVILISAIFVLLFAPIAVFIFINLVDQLTKLVTAAPAISEKLTAVINGTLPSKFSQSFNLDETNLPLGEFLNSTIIVLMSSVVKSFSSLVSIAGLVLILSLIHI